MRQRKGIYENITVLFYVFIGILGHVVDILFNGELVMTEQSTVTNISKQLDKIGKELINIRKQNEKMATRRIAVEKQVIETIDHAIHEFEKQQEKAGYPFAITDELREARKAIV